MTRLPKTESHRLSTAFDPTDEWCLRKRVDTSFEVGLYLAARGVWRWHPLPGVSRWPEARKRAQEVAAELLTEASREANGVASAQRRRASALLDCAKDIRCGRNV
jgi:hypothetical protein